MTISKVNSGGWGTGDELTSAQINGFDTKIITALDKTVAGDTLAGVVALSGAGRIVTTVTNGSDSSTSVAVGSGVDYRIKTGTVTANRTYTLSATSVTANDRMSFFCDADFAYEVTIKDQASNTLFVVGNLSTSDGPWCEVIYISGWRLLFGGAGSRTRSQTFTAGGTFVVPSGVTQLHLFGCGGGGGGGGGASGGTAASTWVPGGGGGGGALASQQIVTVTAGSSYTVTIGTGGAAGALEASGSDGTDSSFGSLAYFNGAKGGRGDTNANTNSNDTSSSTYLHGGSSHNGTSYANNVFLAYGSTGGVPPLPPGNGGHGAAKSKGIDGSRGVIGSAASATGGAKGTNSTTSFGGGGGGGGGAGPFGAGGTGGAGGNGNNAGTASNGSVGSAASANTGGGGGGGGGGGYGSVAGGSGAAGGAGGSGYMIISWVK